MFDVKWIRENPDAFDKGLESRGLAPQSKAVLALDDERRAHLASLQEAQARLEQAQARLRLAQIEPDEVELLVERRAGETEHLVEHAGQREQRRADVEREPVGLVDGQLAPDDGAALEHRHRVPGGPQPDRGRQPADAGADEEIREGIRNHHDLSTELSPASLSGIVQFAEYIVTRMDYPAFPAMHPDLSPALSRYLKENISEFKAMLLDLPREVARAREMYEFQEE